VWGQGYDATRSNGTHTFCSFAREQVECCSSSCNHYPCHNRVSQESLGALAAVVSHPESGAWRLRLGEDLGVHGYIGEFAGHLWGFVDYLTHVESPRLVRGDLSTYIAEFSPDKALLVSQCDSSKQERVVCDASSHGNLTRFIAHSCEPNCHFEHWWVNGTPKLLLFTNSPLSTGTLLTVDYALSWGSVPRPCTCGTATCRGFMDRFLPDASGLDALDAARRTPSHGLASPPAAIAFKLQGQHILHEMVDRDGLDADVALLRFNHIRAFTDGSFVRHPDLGEATTGWGFCVTEHLAHRREAEDRVFAELYGPTFLQSHPFWWIGALREDNNTAELSAIIEFLFYLRDYGIQRYVDQITEQQPLVVVIAPDSAHSIDLLTNKFLPRHQTMHPW